MVLRVFSTADLHIIMDWIVLNDTHIERASLSFCPLSLIFYNPLFQICIIPYALNRSCSKLEHLFDLSRNFPNSLICYLRINFLDVQVYSFQLLIWQPFIPLDMLCHKDQLSIHFDSIYKTICIPPFSWRASRCDALEYWFLSLSILEEDLLYFW